ncbi:MAG: ABC transporter ATP-binding protein [Ferrimicrobium sp.]
MILQTEGLSVGYGHRTVLRDVNIEMLRGQFVGILGPNGCGKSTLLRTIVRALSPVKGAVYVGGERLDRIRQSDLARQMAVVLTERMSPGLLTAFDIVAMGRYPYTGFMGKLEDDDKRRVWDALSMVSAADLAERYFSELSDGESQKVLIARALAQEPELIVLDEPTSHLDVRHGIEVMRILRRLVVEKRVTVLTSLHDVDLIMKVCDMAILVKDGQMIASGPPEEVLVGDVITDLYDISRAGFNSHLGGIEFLGSQDNQVSQVYVVAGAGSGASVYRALTKHNVGTVTGILPENDIDYYVAKAVEAVTIAERPYRAVSTETYTHALELIRRSAQVVDAGFPVGDSNRTNLELIRVALAQGKITYTLRSREEALRLFGPDADRLIPCASVSSLLRKLRAVRSMSLCGNGG